MVHSDAKSVSIPVADMSALIARLEAAEAGSRELDALIEDVFDPLVTCDGPGSHADFLDEPAFEADVGCYTTSLDAALALAERLGLDGFRTVYAALMNWKAHDPRGPASQTLPIALCIAILKAKAQGEGG